MPLRPEDPALRPPGESGPYGDARARELATLRETVRVFELIAAHNEMIAEQYRQLGRSRFFPLAVLLLKVDNVAERFLRRRLGHVPAPQLPSADEIVAREGGVAKESATPLDDPHAQRAGPGRLATVVKGYRLLRHSLAVLGRGHSGAGPSSQYEANPYGQWTETFVQMDDALRNRLLRRVGLIGHQPLVSIVMATYNTDHGFLEKAIESVLAQIYGNFELLVSDDCSPDPGVRRLVERYAARDRRVRLITRPENGGISAATNSAITEAKGEWVTFMDHDDTIVEHALLHVVLAINARPSVALIYSDEDKINEREQLFMPYFKSDFDPLLLLGQNYVCHLTSVRRDLIERVGPLRTEFDGAQDWDLVMRVSEVVAREDIVHIPHVLYHWRSHGGSTSKTSAAKPWALDAGRRAVADALARRGVRAHVAEVAGTGFAEVRFSLPETAPKVSVIVPTRDGALLERCVDSVLERTVYPDYEVVIIDNGSVKPSRLQYFEGVDDRVRVLRDESPFNYSALHNRAVPQCRGDVLLLLNDDTEVLEGDWLEAMVAQLLQPGVGAVGAKLLYPDGRIQHAGVVLGPNALAGHAGQFRSSRDKGYFGRLALASEFQACTAACLAVRRTTWDRLGGFDEDLRVAWNDIDFCLRVRAGGEQVTYTPRAQLIHHESLSRGSDQSGPAFARFMEEIQQMRDRWGLEILRDPYYNPNLSLGHAMFELAYPPRVSPWYTGIE